MSATKEKALATDKNKLPTPSNNATAQVQKSENTQI